MKEHFDNRSSLNSLTNNLPAIIYRCKYDRNWTMLFISEEIQRLTGYSADGFLNNQERSFLSIIHADDQPEVERQIGAALEDYEAYEVEYRLLKSDDEEVWVIDKGRGVVDNNGQISHLEGVITNITHLKEAEQELWQQSKLIEAIIDGVHDVLSIQDKDNRIIRYNKAGYEMLGMTHEEVKGKKCYELIGRKSNCEICPTQKAVKSGKLEHVEKYVPELESYLDCRSNPVFNKDGEIVMIVEQLRDITEQKKSLRMLKESEKNFRDFFETMVDMIFITDLEGRIIHINESVEKKLGYSKKELLNKTVIDIHPREHREETKKYLFEMLAGQRKFCPLPLERKDGRRIPVETRIWKGKWNGKDCYFGIVKDISKEHEALQKFNMFFESSPLMLIVSSYPDNIIQEVNEAFLAKMEYPLPNCVGKTLFELGIYPDGKRDKHLGELIFRENKISNLQVILESASGRKIDGLYSGSVIESQGNKHILSVINDISSQVEADKQLARQNEYIESVLSAIPDLTFVLSLDGVFIDLKAGSSEDLYLPRERFIGKKIDEILPEDLALRFKESIEQSIEEREVQSLQYELVVMNKLSHFEARLSALGKERVIVMVRNITQQKQTERLQTLLMQIAEKYINSSLDDLDDTINESLREMGEFVESDRAYIFDYDWEGGVTSNTYEWCAEGITPEIENLQNVPLEYLPNWVESHKNNRPMYIPDVMSLPENSSLRGILEPQGIQSLLTIPLIDRDNCMGFVGFDSVEHRHEYSQRDRDLLTVFAQMLVNMSNRRHSQELIASQIEMQEMVTKISSDFVSVLNMNFAEKAENLLEQTVSFFKADHGYILFLSEDEKQLEVFKHHSDDGIINQKEQNEIEKIFKQECFIDKINTNSILEINSGDEQIDCGMIVKEIMKHTGISFLTAVPFQSKSRAAGALVYISYEREKGWAESQKAVIRVLTNIFSDAYTRVKAEIELINSKEQAEAANRTKSEFLANISHEIRTPMNSILGFSEVMINMTNDTKQKSYLKTILSSGKTLLSLINDILDLSKIEAGRMEVSPEPCDLRVILNEMEQIFKQKYEEKELDFILEIPGNFPQTILIDEIRLRQVLLNLIGNSIKFTNRGYVKVIVKILKDNSGILDFAIDVIDTGMGIKKNNQESIFESFNQQSGQDSKKYGGTGLGLTISKRLCELMHGKISLQSEPDKGSVFTVSFTDIKYSDEAVETSLDYKWVHDNIAFGRSRVLIVDDVAHNRKLAATYLEDMNLQLSEAENGEVAVKIAKELHPDLILMDIRMPGMNGYEATEILKNYEATSDIIIIALTASTMQSEISQLKEMFDGYLRKPVSKSTMINELMKHLPWEKKNLDEEDSKETLEEDLVSMDKIPAEIIRDFNHKFKDKIELQLNVMMIDKLSELTEEMFAFAEHHRIGWLKTKVIKLKQYVMDFNFENINKSLDTISKAFEE